MSWTSDVLPSTPLLPLGFSSLGLRLSAPLWLLALQAATELSCGWDPPLSGIPSVMFLVHHLVLLEQKCVHSQLSSWGVALHLIDSSVGHGILD